MEDCHYYKESRGPTFQDTSLLNPKTTVAGYVFGQLLTVYFYDPDIIHVICIYNSYKSSSSVLLKLEVTMKLDG